MTKPPQHRAVGWCITLAVLTSACADGIPQDADPYAEPFSSAQPEWRAPTHFSPYVAEQFTLMLPADARVQGPDSLIAATLDSGQVWTEVVGPELRMTVPDQMDSTRLATGSYRTYSLGILTHPNPDRVPLLQFARALADEEGIRAGMTPEELSETVHFFHPPVPDTVAGQLAVWYMPLCADSRCQQVFFGRNDLVVEIFYAFDEYGVPSPLVPMQEMVYAHILETFRWR